MTPAQGAKNSHNGKDVLIADKNGSKPSKLKKLEALAAKRYLNPPKFSYGRDHQHTKTHTRRKSSTSEGAIIKIPSREPSVDLIQTSPKRVKTHHVTPKESSVENDKVLAIDDIKEKNDAVQESEKSPKGESNIVPADVVDNDDGKELENTVLPEADKTEDTQEAEDMGPTIRNKKQVNNKDSNWHDHTELVNEDFPSLKVANRISPGDKFFKSLQKEKTKYHKVLKNKTIQESDEVSRELASPIKAPHTDNHETNKSQSGIIKVANKPAQVESPAEGKSLLSITPKTNATPKKNSLLKSLESTLGDKDNIEELTNTPTRSSRNRRRLVESASHSKEVDSSPTMSAQVVNKPTITKMELPKKVKNGTLNKSASAIKIVESFLTKEMKSMRGIRDTSPTPTKRKRATAQDDTIALAKKIRLLHTDDVKELFGDSSPIDTQDRENSSLLPSSQETAFNSALSSPVKGDSQTTELLKEIVEQVSVSTEDVDELKQVVLKRLDGQLPPLKLYGLDDHYHQLYRMLRNTIKNQEGNSCLIMGPSGTGKKTTVNKVINDLNEKYHKQFITVKLSGAVQTDEKLAIRSIAQQLDDAISTYQESEQQEFKITDARNSNRTLRALLKVLDQNDLNDYKTKSIDRNLSVAIVFIIDDFHKFTEYNRQSLLYNLFDLSQNSNTPISVVGLTTKITTREMLEKRVKSRFSQKIIMFNKPLIIEDFVEQFLQNCMINKTEISNNAYTEAYNNYLNKAAKTVDSPLHKHLVVNYYTIKSIKESLSALIMPIAKITSKNPFPEFSSLLEGEDPYSNELIRKIQSLSDLELSLLLSCCRVVFKSELNVVDFNSCYNEYHSAMSLLKAERISSMTNFDSATGVVIDLKIWPKANTKRAWELLQKLGLIVDNSLTSNSYNAKKVNQNQSFNAFSVVVTLEELRKCVDKQSQLHALTTV